MKNQLRFNGIARKTQKKEKQSIESQLRFNEIVENQLKEEETRRMKTQVKSIERKNQLRFRKNRGESKRKQI